MSLINLLRRDKPEPEPTRYDVFLRVGNNQMEILRYDTHDNLTRPNMIYTQVRSPSIKEPVPMPFKSSKIHTIFWGQCIDHRKYSVQRFDTIGFGPIGEPFIVETSFPEEQESKPGEWRQFESSLRVVY